MAAATGRTARRGCLAGWLMILSVCPGCMNRQLQTATERTMGTLPELQYGQIVDNLATIAANRAFLPYLAVVGQGAIQVTDNGNASLALSLSTRPANTEGLTLGASRNVTGTWSLATITSPEKIRAMHLLYQQTVKGAITHDPAYRWLNIGCRRDVPRQAYFVGRHKDVFVWVMPEGIAGLSELSLAIMDIATREDGATPPAATKEPFRQKAAPPGVVRRNFQVPPMGPVFTPGAN